MLYTRGSIPSNPIHPSHPSNSIHPSTSIRRWHLWSQIQCVLLLLTLALVCEDTWWIPHEISSLIWVKLLLIWRQYSCNRVIGSEYRITGLSFKRTKWAPFWILSQGHERIILFWYKRASMLFGDKFHSWKIECSCTWLTNSQSLGRCSSWVISCVVKIILKVVKLMSQI